MNLHSLPVFALAATMLCASFASTEFAASAAATTPVKLTVPIQLENIDATFTKLQVQCFVTIATVEEANTSVASAFGEAGTIAQTVNVPLKAQASFTTSIAVTLNVPTASFSTYKAYVCSMGEFVSSSGNTSPSLIPLAVGSKATLRVIGALR